MKRFVVLAVTMMTITSCSSSEQSRASVKCPPADEVDITAITTERADLLVGLPEEDAQRCAEKLGWAYRVGARDGENFALTADYSQQRVTVTVTLGVVTAISVG